MGYNTIFKGELKFKPEPTIQALAKLKKIFGEDARLHPEWLKHGTKGLYHFDLVLTDRFDGVRWDDKTEKTYDLEKIVTAVISIMREEFPDFALTGHLTAQGEDAEDRWDLVMDDAGTTARKVTVPIPGTKTTCPDCGHTFYVE